MSVVYWSIRDHFSDQKVRKTIEIPKIGTLNNRNDTQYLLDLKETHTTKRKSDQVDFININQVLTIAKTKIPKSPMTPSQYSVQSKQ